MESVDGSNSTVWQCTINTGSVQGGRISKHRNKPLSLGETFHGELGFVSGSTMSGILQVSLLNGKVHSSFCHHFKNKWCALHFAVMCGFWNSGSLREGLQKKSIGKQALNLMCPFR